MGAYLDQKIEAARAALQPTEEAILAEAREELAKDAASIDGRINEIQAELEAANAKKEAISAELSEQEPIQG